MSFLYLEIKYAKMVGQALERFKIKKEIPFHANSRCPLCGDSEKDKRKARFHILEADGKLIYKCFNCDAGGSFTYFLKANSPQLHNEYVFERYRSETTDAPIITTPKSDDVSFVSKQIKRSVGELFSLELPYVRELDKTHPVTLYVASRGLPDYPFQYAEKFYEFASQFNEDLGTKGSDEPRLIIPFFDRKGNVFAFQGRDLLGKSQQKYITIVIDKTIPKIFGIDRLDIKKPVIMVEGPIDSLFLPNCLASVNASLVSTAKRLSPIINKTQLTLVYDNEPRNFNIVAMYKEAIDLGYNVVIWPTSKDGKKEDINDLVLSGKDPLKIIQQNTYSGLMAQIKFQQWKKV